MKFLSTLILLIFSFSGQSQCPTADFNLNPAQSCAIPQVVFFTDQSTTPDTWLWSFGDGSTSTLQNPVHTYTSTGIFLVTLTVSDTNFGCIDQATSTVTISTISADFVTPNSFGCNPLQSNFMDLSSGFGSAIEFWAWDFGDGNTSDIETPMHTYNDPGNYSVSLTVTDFNGCSSTETKSNYITVIGPNVDFGGDILQGCNTLNVNFTDFTIAGAPIISWYWDFGDGNNSTSINPTNNFVTSGDFDVSLTVTDIDGCSITETKTEYVSLFTSANGIDTRVECDSLEWIDGNTYYFSNSSATHTIIGGAANSCDSTVALDLTIIESVTTTDVRNVCDSLLWIDGNTYTFNNNTATFNFIGGAANSCDSLVTLDLTIIDFNLNVTQSNELLTADYIGSNYQWVKCPEMSIITGATEQSYMALENGEYAVILSNNGCSDTSNCYQVSGLGILEHNFENIKVYPNPANGEFSVDLGSNYKSTVTTITDLNGKIIQTNTFKNSQILNLIFDKPAGIYFLNINSGDKNSVVRLVKI